MWERRRIFGKVVCCRAKMDKTSKTQTFYIMMGWHDIDTLAKKEKSNSMPNVILIIKHTTTNEYKHWCNAMNSKAFVSRVCFGCKSFKEELNQRCNLAWKCKNIHSSSCLIWLFYHWERENSDLYYSRIKLLGSCLFLQSVPANQDANRLHILRERERAYKGKNLPSCTRE